MLAVCLLLCPLPLGQNCAAQFQFADFGLLPPLFDEAFLNPKYGARDDSVKLVFTVTDGNMEMNKEVFTKNGCPEDNASYSCANVFTDPAEFASCSACWRTNLVAALGARTADTTLYGVGVGVDQDVKTVEVFAEQIPHHVLRESLVLGDPHYAQLQRRCAAAAACAWCVWVCGCAWVGRPWCAVGLSNFAHGT